MPGGVPLPEEELRRTLLKELANRPLKEAARELGLGVSTFKKLCREAGVPRWPFRQLESLARTQQRMEAWAIDDAADLGQRALADLVVLQDGVLAARGVYTLPQRVKRLCQDASKLAWKVAAGLIGEFETEDAAAADAAADAAAAGAAAAGAAARQSRKRAAEDSGDDADDDNGDGGDGACGVLPPTWARLKLFRSYCAALDAGI